MNKIKFFHGYDPLRKALTLRNASYFPEEIFEYADQIEILDISNGSLKDLPDRLPELSKLKIVFFSNNLFTEFPGILSECLGLKVVGFKSCQISSLAENSIPKNVQWLILTGNCLTKLPDSIGSLTKLQKLALSGNRLVQLPEQLSNCHNLELLRLSANNLKNEPPSWLFQLPRLAWYADSGNLFQSQNTHVADLPLIGYDRIKFLRPLGESPSSEVWEADIEGFASSLAVKKYKGIMTSDGYIEDDLLSSIKAGQHPNIITVRGKLDPEPGQQAGLIMDLISAEYQSLGKPPSLESCTRDTFPSGTNFSLDYVVRVLKNIASAMKHLHKQGLTHGDLYAHNILANSSGDCFLGDFGAASSYNPAVCKQREYLESRAFGYLMEDLLQRCSEAHPQSLTQLQKECLATEVKKRPLMNEIYDSL